MMTNDVIEGHLSEPTCRRTVMWPVDRRVAGRAPAAGSLRTSYRPSASNDFSRAGRNSSPGSHIGISEALAASQPSQKPNSAI